MSFQDSSPRPVITYIGDDESTTRPHRRLALRCGLLLVSLGFAAAMTACSVSIGTDTDPSVESTSDIAVGECLQIGDQPDDEGKVSATKVSCDAEGLTFYAASTVAAESDCAGDNSASLSFDGDSDKLCMTPNFVGGQCYQIPVSGGRLVDYREADCTAAAASNSVIAEAVTRSDESVTCTQDQTKWAFSNPESLGYCLRAVDVT